MRLTVKTGVPKVLPNFNEAFIGHLNAHFLENNARTVGSSDRLEFYGSFIKRCRLTLDEWFAKSCLSHCPIYEGKINPYIKAHDACLVR